MPGVAEVAPLGGFVRQYQVNVDPNRLQAYNIPINKVVEAVRSGNNDVGGRLVEFTGREYMVRGRGYAQIARRHRQHRRWRPARRGMPVLVRDVGHGDARARHPPRRRRLDGKGDTVGGIVVMRQGENALQRHRAREGEARRSSSPSLPPGVKIVTTYDRSELIQRSIDNLKHTLIEE